MKNLVDYISLTILIVLAALGLKNMLSSIVFMGIAAAEKVKGGEKKNREVYFYYIITFLMIIVVVVLIANGVLNIKEAIQNNKMFYD